MYKIYFDKNQCLTDLTLLNSFVKSHFNNQELIFSEIIIHPYLEKFAIYISRTDILNIAKETLTFIDTNWLSLNVINNLSEDWTIPFQDMLIKIVIPNKLILENKSLYHLKEYLDLNSIKYIIKEEYSYIGLNFLYDIHKQELSEFSEIKIIYN